ncbi:MAG: recombinase family protein, partial [Phycisphaeraceae bacterium JB051]
MSGSELHRPGLDQLMQTATDDPEVQIVLAWDRNRIARPKDAVDGMLLERQIRKAGKRVVYAATGRETDQSFESGLMGYIEHHQNGDYLRKLSRDTMRGIVSRVQRGLWPGGPIPFGYDRLLLDG